MHSITTKYHVVDGNVTFETNGTNKIYYTYDSEDKLVSIELNGVEYYYVRNAQGDIISLIDSSGDEVVSYTYDTWGRLLSIDGKLKDSLGVKNPYRYRGYRYDNETEFYYLQSRYYNPEWGRFLNADSLVGETGELLSHNMFAYCSNDPVNNEDPDGDIAWWVGAAVGGAAFDSAMYLIQHRRGGATWKGLGKAAAGGAISGVLFGGAGKLASKGVRALKAAKKVKKVGKVASKVKKASTVRKVSFKKTINANPLSNIKFTSKVKGQMQLGDYHSFPKSVEAFGSHGKVTKLTGGDGVVRTRVHIKGSYKGKNGVFEYIIEPNGTCNHRLFQPNYK